MLNQTRNGIGTGAGSGYYTDLTEKIKDQKIWRALYGGYLGKDWTETSLENDDDWYFTTKTVVHCVVNETSPKDVYEIPDHIVSSDVEAGLTLKDIQRRAKKILDEAEKLYEYAMNSNDEYREAKVTISKNGNYYNDGNNVIQKYEISANKAVRNYDIKLTGFPEGTNYTKNGTELKIIIPQDSIKDDVNGLININNIEVKTCPAFYAKAQMDKYQDYVLISDPFEKVNSYTNFSLNSNKSKIEILKIDAETKEPVSDCTFEISKDGKIIKTVTTNNQGIANISDLKPGKYQVKEIKSNENYELSEENTKEISVGYNKTIKVEFENEHKKGNLKVYKVDKDNHKVALGNVEFDLYSDEFKKVIGTYKTDANGEIYIENLRTGNYRLIEKTTNKWYNLTGDTEIKIEWDKTKETVIENELKKGQIRVIKVDLDNNEIKLKGVKFNVLDEDNNVLETVITNDKGEAVTSKYPVRDFEKLILQEVETLENYKLTEKPQTIELKANEVVDVVFQNEKKKGQVKVIKIDEDNNEIRLEGVEFKVYDESGNVVDTLKTDKNGEAISKKLPIDQEYTVQETNTLENYVLTEEPQTVILKEDQITNLTFTNEKKKGQIKVIKIDEDNNEIKLEGVEFKVYDESGNVVDTLKTDKNGEAISKRLPIDQEYTIQESKTLENYVLTEKQQTVILEQDQITDITFTNEKIKGKIEITKISADDNELTGETKGTKLDGAVFEIYNFKDELVDTITIKEGIGTSKLLEYGDYYIKEINSGSDNYLLNTDKYEIEIRENLKTIPITIENTSVDIGLDIDKNGVIQAQPNDEIKYSFNSLKNTSNVALDNFTWTDNLPYEYVKITKLFTGTYNEDLDYVVKYKTNKIEDYIEFGKYNTQKNNYIDFTTVELTENEYITDFKVEFGTVMPGFEAVEKPFIFAKVLPTVQPEDRWINYTSLTGNYEEHELEDKAEWPTISYGKELEIKKLPRTGF